ncbi:hypothetical protein ACFFJB_01365 [Camelimonas abortus]|uniref:Urease accessory protein UreE n=1 Tax=Camelimonas abortus TaxID=1017184 RepID=A0ABV7LGB3_9HYPH
MSAIPAIITGVLGQFDAAAATGETDVLELTSEERASPHFTAYTRAGRRLRLSLPRGTELQDGDVLHRDDALTIIVRAAAEELLLLRPGADPVEWNAACYQLGNLHRPARFLPGGVLTPRDPMVEQFLARLAVRVERTTRPFTGRRFGAAGAHHHHDHDDGHGHAHGRDHAHVHTHTHTHAHSHVHSHAHDHGHAHDQRHGHGQAHGDHHDPRSQDHAHARQPHGLAHG